MLVTCILHFYDWCIYVIMLNVNCGPVASILSFICLRSRLYVIIPFASIHMHVTTSQPSLCPVCINPDQYMWGVILSQPSHDPVCINVDQHTQIWSSLQCSWPHIWIYFVSYMFIHDYISNYEIPYLHLLVDKYISSCFQFNLSSVWVCNYVCVYISISDVVSFGLILIQIHIVCPSSQLRL